jgi:hypothetical protein
MPNVLPMPPRRATLRAFGMVTGFLTVLLGLVALLALPSWVAWAAFSAGAFPVGLGALAPNHLGRPYLAWNRLGRAYFRVARAIVLRIVHASLFIPIRRSSSDPRITSELTNSMWMARAAEDGTLVGTHPRGADWLRSYSAWAVRTKPWALALVPFLLVLRAMGTEDLAPPPPNIYTLY